MSARSQWARPGNAAKIDGQARGWRCRLSSVASLSPRSCLLSTILSLAPMTKGLALLAGLGWHLPFLLELTDLLGAESRFIFAVHRRHADVDLSSGSR
jgi:hypothetical protein